MSIRGYLFLLFAALILALGLGQVLMMDYFKSDLQAQLQHSTKALSQDLVRVVIAKSKDEAIEDLDFNREYDAALQAADRHRINELHKVIAELEHDIKTLAIELAQPPQAGLAADLSVFDMTQAEKHRQLDALHQALSDTVEKMVSEEVSNSKRQWDLARLRAMAEQKYEQKVQQTLANIDIDTQQWLQDGEVFISKHEGPMGISRTNVPLENQAANAKLDEFGESLFMVILASSLLAMLLTYWLAHHITRPLSALAEGHKQLGLGRLGVQIKLQGVRELKDILQGFNTMSRQLSQWRTKVELMSEQQHLADLGQVAKGIAHSLRNPLHTLGLLSEQASFAADERQRQTINQQVQQKIALMDKNIQSLLTLANENVNRSEDLAFKAVIQDILLEVSMGHRQPLMFAADGLKLVLPASESEVRSILHAVIINAIEASPEDKSVHIECDELEDYYRVKVTDKGQGIDERVKARMFEPHVSTKSEGSGMGLYLAKRIVSSHYGGDIKLEPNPEGGTVVSVLFAKTQPQARSQPQNTDQPQTTAEGPL